MIVRFSKVMNTSSYQLCLWGLLFCLVAGPAFAQEANQPTCVTGIRVIRGLDSGPEVRKMKLRTGPNLRDVRGQLQTLPFKQFRILDRKEARVKVRERAEIQVMAANDMQHVVSVQPHLVSNGKVHFTLDWQGENGEELLSTKLRVKNGKSVVLGTDNSHNMSTILCVTLDCD